MKTFDSFVPRMSIIPLIACVALAVVGLLALPALALGLPLLGSTVHDEILETTTPATHKVRDVSTALTFIRPSYYPLDTILRRADVRRGARRAKQVKVEWEEDESIPRSTTLSGAGAGGASPQTLTVAAGTGVYFRVDDLWYLPADGTVLHVTDKPATDQIEVRAIISATSETAYSAVPATSNLDEIVKLARAREEKSNAGASLVTMPAQLYNYTQIFETVVGWSATRAVTENYTMDDKARSEMQALYDYRQDLEYAAIFGQRALINDPTNSKQRSFQYGIVGYLSSNDINYTTGSLTESLLIDYMKQIFSGNSGSRTRLWFSTPDQTAEIDKLLINTNGGLQWNRNERVLGVEATRIHSTFGDLMLINHEGLGEMGKTNWGLVVDPANVRRRPLRPMRVKNVTAPDVDGTDMQWLEECTLEVRYEKTHAVIRDTATDTFL